ncbi:hypothetical protein AAC387_Pa08g0407 [Persea americana]
MVALGLYLSGRRWLLDIYTTCPHSVQTPEYQLSSLWHASQFTPKVKSAMNQRALMLQDVYLEALQQITRARTSTTYIFILKMGFCNSLPWNLGMNGKMKKRRNVISTAQ